MTKTIHFNTKRQYTAKGQRVTATLHEGGIVTFWDHDRHIDGEFAILDDVFFNQGTIMSEYDGGRYKSTTLSWSNGMQVNGINAVYKGRDAFEQAAH